MLAPSELERAYAVILAAALRGEELHAGVIDTPVRAARALMEMTGGYDVDVPALFTTFERDGYDEMIVERGIPFVSLCEHHLLPFIGTAAVAYVPNGGGRIVGLSKIARVVDAYARRLQVQERLTQQIADAFWQHLDPAGVMVVVRCRHLCMELRGVKTAGVPTATSVVRGVFKDDPRARAEALTLLGGTP